MPEPSVFSQVPPVYLQLQNPGKPWRWLPTELGEAVGRCCQWLRARRGVLCSCCWEQRWLRAAGSGGRGQAGLHQGQGGGNKRDEEGALNSIVLRKETAVRRESSEHGVSGIGVSLHVLGAVSVMLPGLGPAAGPVLRLCPDAAASSCAAAVSRLCLTASLGHRIGPLPSGEGAPRWGVSLAGLWSWRSPWAGSRVGALC